MEVAVASVEMQGGVWRMATAQPVRGWEQMNLKISVRMDAVTLLKESVRSSPLALRTKSEQSEFRHLIVVQVTSF